MKKYIGIAVAVGLIVALPLYAAAPNPLNRLISILAQSLGLQNQFLQQIAENTAPKLILGSTGSRGLRLSSSASATTSPTYFGVGGTKTATTTLLTVGCTTAGNQPASPNNLSDIDTLGIYVQATASTSGSIIYIEPKVSNDCVDWYNMSSISDQVTTAGSAVSLVTLPTASTTIISWTPTQTTLQLTQFTFRNLAAKAIQFNVSSATASSSVWMQAAAVERITR